MPEVQREKPLTACVSTDKLQKRTSTRLRNLLTKPCSPQKTNIPPQTQAELSPPSPEESESDVSFVETELAAKASPNYEDSADSGVTSLSSSSSEELPEKPSNIKSLCASYGFDSVEKLLDVCFNKICPISSNVSHLRKKVPLYESPKWTDYELREFLAQKKKLNDMKNKLDNFELNEWHMHTRTTNPSGRVIRNLRDEMRVEFPTQAWCKFYELLHEFRLIPKEAVKSKELFSIHLCEAPGAFIASLNHYLKLNHSNMKWSWKANTLNPYYEGNTLSQMINDDRFMLHTIDHWDFGSDFTGDITHPDYANHLKAKCGNKLAHLVTADGSFDCQDQPNEQESSVSWLHLKETLTALRVLRPGGHFVIKMFTFFECDTICLLYLLVKVFESVIIKKPVTSKEGNSEVYVVCREYVGECNAEPHIRELFEITEERHRRNAMFSYREVIRPFMTKVIECATQFSNYQISALRRNINLFECRHNKELQSQFAYVQQEVWKRFVRTYQIRPISPSEHIVPSSIVTRRRMNIMEKREYKQGSHADNVLRLSLPKEDVFGKIRTELKRLENDHHSMGTIRRRFMPDIDVQTVSLKCITGKPIEIVQSSQYCHGTLMRMRNELISTMSALAYNRSSCDPKTYNRKICQVSDVRGYFAEIENYSYAQYKAFCTICDVLFEMDDHEDFLLIGFPLFTQFSVQLLCILKTFFVDDVVIEDESCLRFKSLDTKARDRWNVSLKDIQYAYTSDKAVMSFLPVGFVENAKTPLYWWLVDVNNYRVREEIRRVLNSR